MKNIITFLAIGLLTLGSCKKDEEVVPTKTIFNNTDFEVTLTNTDYNYTIGAGRTISINSDDEQITWATITPTDSTSKLFDVVEKDGNYEVESFDYWFEYRVTGPSQRAYLEYFSPVGVNDTVSLPFIFTSKEKLHSSSALSMKARNGDNTNSRAAISVECYYKDVLIATDECDELYCTAEIYVNEF